MHLNLYSYLNLRVIDNSGNCYFGQYFTNLLTSKSMFESGVRNVELNNNEWGSRLASHSRGAKIDRKKKKRTKKSMRKIKTTGK